MITLNISFINFWSYFNVNNWFKIWKNTFYHPNIIWKLNQNNKPDVLVSSVFGSINNLKKYKCKKILYTRENLNFEHYNHYKNNLDLFNLIIGFNDMGSQINVPYYYSIIKEKNLQSLNVNKNYAERKNLCLISRNPHPLRSFLIDSFKSQNYSIDCPGDVGNNMKIKVDNKIEFIQDYYFNICPENSYAEGYVTEKLFDCCIAGCVPIYYGCERLNDGFYNKHRILHIKKNLSNYNEIIDQAIFLLNHKSKLIEFINQNPFVDNYQQHVDAIQQKIHTNLEQLFL